MHHGPVASAQADSFDEMLNFENVMFSASNNFGPVEMKAQAEDSVPQSMNESISWHRNPMNVPKPVVAPPQDQSLHFLKKRFKTLSQSDSKLQVSDPLYKQKGQVVPTQVAHPTLTVPVIQPLPRIIPTTEKHATPKKIAQHRKENQREELGFELLFLTSYGRELKTSQKTSQNESIKENYANLATNKSKLM